MTTRSITFVEFLLIIIVFFLLMASIKGWGWL